MSIRDKGEVPNRVNSLNFEEIYIQHLTSGIAFGDSVDVGMWKRFKSCFTCGIRAGNRSGSPDKLTNVSSSVEGDAPEQYHGQDKKNSEKTNLGADTNGGEPLGHKNECAQAIQSEVNENLRHRSSAKNSSQNLQHTEDEAATVATVQRNVPSILTSSLETQSENDKTENEKDYLGDVLPPYETKKVKIQESEIKTTAACDTILVSDQNTTGDALKSTQDIEQEAQVLEQTFVQQHEPDNIKEVDNTQEDANINNAIDSVNGPLSDVVQKVVREDILLEEPIVNVSEAVSSEAAVLDLQEESSFTSEWRESIKGQENITGDLSVDNNVEVNANEAGNPQGIEEVRNSHVENSGNEPFIADVVPTIEDHDDSVGENVEIVDENENAYLMPSNDLNIADPLVNEVDADNVINEFSDRLSKCIVDAVRQDTVLLYSQSEDEGEENQNKQSVLKFSDALAKSIVKCVLDYAKVSQDHILEHDEHDHLSPNVTDVRDKASESNNRYEPSPTNEEELFSADEANNDTCANNLHEYAKTLSQEILNDALDLSAVSSCISTTNAYASQLTKSVLSNAINGAKSLIADSNSLPDSDFGAESALDLFVAEIVGNAIESAFSRIGKESHNDADEECNGIEGDLQGPHGEHSDDVHDHMDREGQLGRCNGENIGERGELFEDNAGNNEGHFGNDDHMDNGEYLEIHNGEIDIPAEKSNHDENEPEKLDESNAQVMEQNGKLQSKWLNEDDLDELYDDNLSDEETDNLGDDQPLNGANNFTTPNDDKQTWRKSLIQDLDEEFDSEDDIDTPRSSASSSPNKSGNFEDLINDGSVGGDDDVLEVPDNVKAQPPVIKTTDSSRSRLRSVDTTPVLVLDNGSAFLKAGFSDQPSPSQIVSSVVGTPLRYSQDISGMEYGARSGLVFGTDAVNRAGVLHIEYPLKSDLIERWSDVEGLWNYVLGSLMCIDENPEFPILISQSALNPKKNTEKIAEIMFEHFHMPSLFIADQLALSLFSMGYTSGLSFTSGFKSTQAGVVYEGHVLPHSVKQLDIAGYQLTENLKKLLMSLQGFGFRSSSQWQVVDDIKKKLGFFSLDFQADSERYKSQADLQTTYELPDGQLIEVGLERFGCAESLFRPMEVGLTQSPAHTLIIEAINSCEEELQELCYKAMGVSGGTTEMAGFIARLEQELREHDRKFKNLTFPERRDLSTWLGGSVVASLPTFREMVVTVDEYAEAGTRVVHSKCF